MRTLIVLLLVLALLLLVAFVATIAFRQAPLGLAYSQPFPTAHYRFFQPTCWIIGARRLMISLPMLFVAGMLVLFFILMRFQLRGGGSKKARRVHTEESRMMQDLHQGLEELSGRIEALETILMDRAGKG